MGSDKPDGPAVQAKMAADVDAPDKILYGLTFRQLAVLAVTAVVLYTAWEGLHAYVPVPILLAAGAVIGGLVFALVISRRDGLPMDAWLLAALRQARQPRALSTTDTAPAVPDWVQPPAARVRLPAPLRLPADAIADDGQISLAGTRAAIVAATTVNLALRTNDEQAALIDAYGRWLNSLSTPTQILVSAQPVDLRSHARTLAATAGSLPHPGLVQACADHAAFLQQLAEQRDPLRRQVLVVGRAPTGDRAGKQVVQVYAERADSAVERPARWLVGFATVHAAPGETVTATIPVPARRLAHWDGGWVVSELELIEPGLYLDVSPANAGPFADLVQSRLSR